MPKIADSFRKFVRTLDLKLEDETKVHLRRVYGTLSVSMMMAALGAYIHLVTDYFKGSIWTLLLSIGVFILINGTPPTRQNQGLRFSYLAMFAALSGMSTGPLLMQAMAVNPKIIVTAFFGTCAVFTSFTLAAIYAPSRKYLYLIGTLLTMLSCMCWLSLFNLFLNIHFFSKVNLYIGLVVMVGFILYDTQFIIDKRVNQGDEDYIDHSMDLFIDFMGLFRRLLIILLEKERRKKKQ